MTTIPILVVLILTIYVAIAQLDQISIQIGLYSPLFAGTITGILMGDVTTGLLVGGSMQLLTLGVATYGGASVPDFLSGTIVGTAYAIVAGTGSEFGVAVAVPVGLLLVQLDVFGRMTNLIFQHRADRCAENADTKGVELSNILGMIPWTLTRMIPVFIGLYFGETVIAAIDSVIPDWLMTGLRYAGGILPAMGIALLMRYLPVKKFFPYYIIGFAIMAYLSSTFTILGVSLVGLALAAIYLAKTPETAVAVADANDMEVEVDDDDE